MSLKPTDKVSNHLPKDVRDALVAASKIRDPKEKQAAVQEAIERAQIKYPQFFKHYEGATQ